MVTARLDVRCSHPFGRRRADRGRGPRDDSAWRRQAGRPIPGAGGDAGPNIGPAGYPPPRPCVPHPGPLWTAPGTLL